MQTQTKLTRPAAAFIRRNWPILLFCLAHAVIFLVIFRNNFLGYTSKDNFIEEYYYALKMGFGQMPYRDFAVEYPPLALLLTAIPRLISPLYNSYLLAYSVEMLVFDLIGIFVLSALAKELNLNRWKTLGIYTVALLAIGPLITVRFDIIPAVITLLALYAFIKGRHKTAWALLAVGTFVKIYPVILAPLFLIYCLIKGQKRQALTGIASFAVVSAVILIPALVLSPSGLWYSFAYHAHRGLQIESVYASFLELFYGFKLIPLGFELTSGSVNLVSPTADLLAKVSFGVMGLGLLAVYWFFYRGLKRVSGTEKRIFDAALLLNYSLLTVLVFMLTSKVLSPQYIIWIFPLIPLVTGRWRNTTWLLFVMAGLMTFFIYPEYYDGIESGALQVIAMLALRNAVLIIIMVLVTAVIHKGIITETTTKKIKKTF